MLIRNHNISNKLVWREIKIILRMTSSFQHIDYALLLTYLGTNQTLSHFANIQSTILSTQNNLQTASSITKENKLHVLKFEMF